MRSLLCRKGLLTVALLSMSTHAAVQATFYVSPTGAGDYSAANPGAISGIAAKVRTVNAAMTGDIVVNLKGGRYLLSSTFLLTAQDGGTNGHTVIYQAAPGEAPLLSGGMLITGWTMHDAAKNIYQATVGMGIDSRGLYVNGKRAIRARSRDGMSVNIWTDGYDANYASGYENAPSICLWKNLTNVEIVDTVQWQCFRTLVAGGTLGASDCHLPVSAAAWKNMGGWWQADGANWIENAYELLDSEGEWYLDRSTGILYYKPRAGEDMSTAEALLFKLEKVVQMSGVSNLQMSGVTVSHGTWLKIDSIGFAHKQADLNLIDNGLIGATVSLDHCKYVRFVGNTVTQTGGTGIEPAAGCQNCMVGDNVVMDVSGSGIRAGAPVANPPAADVLLNDTIYNNLVRDMAVEYLGSVGIYALFTDHLVMTHNEIRHCPYSAISIGWSWGSNATVAKNCEVAYNLIDSCMLVLADGGGIYSLGAQPGSNAHDNWINHDLREPYGALYCDDGSSGVRMHHNVESNAEVMWLTAKNNVVIDSNYHDLPDTWDVTAVDNTVAPGYVRNNFYVTGGNWPPEAVAIMNNAGRVKGSTQTVKQSSVGAAATSSTRMTLFNGVNIEVPRGTREITCSIMNASGRLVHRNSFAFGSSPPPDIRSALPAGIYYVKVQLSGGTGLNQFAVSRMFVAR